jgi:transcriptional regulator with XRE-family HTH domain
MALNLGDALVCWRLAAGRGVRDAAKEMGISSATLNRIENGGMPDAETLVKLLNWFFKPRKSD